MAEKQHSMDAFVTAVKDGDVNRVEVMLRDKKVGVNDRFKFGEDEGWSALMLACWNGYYNMAKCLLERGADVNLQDDRGRCALKQASFNNYYDIVKLLLGRGAAVDLQNKYGWTALMNACKHGHYKLAKLLLERGADPNIQRSSGRSALMSASGNGRYQVAELLVKFSAHVNLRDIDGETALSYAKLGGHSQVAEMLIERAEIESQGNDRLSVEKAEAILHKEAYERIIKEKKTVNARYVRFINIGIPRSGKTTFWRRLMKQMVNITIARMLGAKEEPSTGLAEQRESVVLKNVSSIAGAVTAGEWCILDDDMETKMLLQLFSQLVKDNSSTANTHSSSQILESNEAKRIHQAITAEEKNAEEVYSTLFRRAAEGQMSDKYKLEEVTLLYGTDTGGHAEFLDMHAALINGPSFNLLFSRLNDDLDDLFKVYFTDDKGRSSDEEDSVSTTAEVMFQALSSITCLGNSHRAPDATTAHGSADIHSVMKDLKSCQSKVLFVGTYKDTVSDDDFRRKDCELHQKIQDTACFTKNVLFAKPDIKQLILPVDNMFGGDDEIDEIRAILEKKLDNYFERIPVPASWLVLSLHFRIQKSPTMNFKDCREIAAKFNIDGQELQHALWFLHHGLGVILYYPKASSLENTVFCKIQAVFDSVALLIKKTYTPEIVDIPSADKFKKFGEFSLENVPKSIPDSPIPRTMLVKILEHLNIITVIPAASCQQSQHAVTENLTYFMPCILRSATERNMCVPPPKEGDPSHLVLRYDCGCTPVGIFPSIITNLISQQREWKLIKDGLYKNRVEFHLLPDYHKITLISHHRYFKICFSQRRVASSHQMLNLECNKVRGVVAHTLKAVTSRMNYDFNMGYKYGFEFPCHGKEHLYLLHGDAPKCMQCIEDPEEIIDLEPRHMLWFPVKKKGIPEDLPTLPEFLCFPMPTSKVNLAEKIGTDYYKFGTLLLEDDEGDRIDAMEKEFRGRAEDINCQVFRRWLKGHGRKPVSWDTLVSVLHDIGQTKLASEITEVKKL